MSEERLEHTRKAASMRGLIWPSVGTSFVKLDPREMARNPVMFVVEVGSAITTIYFVLGLIRSGSDTAFIGAVAGWLWFTVLFANFATALAEGRGKAQAATLRKTKTETLANLVTPEGVTQVAAGTLRKGDVVMVSAGEMIPGDGDVIEGIASVDESAITGESAPVIRESGGDRSAVTGGTIGALRPGEDRDHVRARRDLPRPHDRPRGRCGAPEDAQRDRPHDPAGRPDAHLHHRDRDARAFRDLQQSAGLRDAC